MENFLYITHGCNNNNNNNNKSPKSKNLSFVIAKSLEISGKLDIYDSWVFPEKKKKKKKTKKSNSLSFLIAKSLEN